MDGSADPFAAAPVQKEPVNKASTTRTYSAVSMSRSGDFRSQKSS